MLGFGQSPELLGGSPRISLHWLLEELEFESKSSSLGCAAPAGCRGMWTSGPRRPGTGLVWRGHRDPSLWLSSLLLPGAGDGLTSSPRSGLNGCCSDSQDVVLDTACTKSPEGQGFAYNAGHSPTGHLDQNLWESFYQLLPEIHPQTAAREWLGCRTMFRS